ncbi:hypothetical protein O181_107308 [Austropuccinia psidii MF-1]|uniref:DUF4939 domain-containing protein n=1 Tax=Austropuccinia psidii MF-1 TaxID=1389203 RepID=A0A9Q3JQL4_9BASI|nr:hypothetical protein [Austropuccinia psidii MF-1]
MEGEEPSRRGGPRSRLGEAEYEEESDENETAASLTGDAKASGAKNLALSNQPPVSQAEPNFLKMMEQITQFMGKVIQAVSPRDNSKTPAFKTSSIKAPDSFDDTQAHTLRAFIQACQLIFHNGPSNSFSNREKVFHSTYFLTCRVGKWIEPYLPNIFNENPSYLLNNRQLFETQLFMLFCDQNEVRKAEQELENLRMKESQHVCLYIADSRN